jgi:hypothetical protein
VYAPKIITQKLALAEEQMGFEPIYHNRDYIRQCVSHLESLVDEKGMLVRNLDPEEQQFISNERAICAADFKYYAENYAFIQHFEGGLQLIDFSIAQKIMVAQWAELESMYRAILCIILKARQLGMSTLCELALAHRVQFQPETWSIVGSNNPAKSETMVGMMQKVFDRMPWWLMPRSRRDKVGERVEFPTQYSGTSIAHGSAMSGIGRGSTLQAFHLSELAEYLNAAELVDASLMPAVHESPFVFGMLESTAKGKGPTNWWHTKWQVSKEGYWKGEAQFCPVFLPWFVGRDINPTQTWLRTRPIPANWAPSTLTEQHANRAREYVQTNGLLRKHLGENWLMPREQMWYWETKRNLAIKEHELGKFYEEMPADDQEAFQASGKSIFDITLIAEMREKAKRPVGVYGLVGAEDEIPAVRRPEARDIDTSKPPIEITARWTYSRPAHHYKLVPLKMDRWPEMPINGSVIIWEMPRKGFEYGLGIDTGFGISKDRSVIEGIRKGTAWANDAQVFELAANDLNAQDLWPYAMALGTLYAVVNDGIRKQPKMVIECAANGEMTQLELRKRGWTNFHRHLRYDRTELREDKSQRLGWYMHEWARKMMLNKLITSVRDGWVDLNSPELISELASFYENPNNLKLEALPGHHDDRIMALGIVLFSMHILETRGGTLGASADRARRAADLSTAPRYQDPLQATAPDLATDTEELQRFSWDFGMGHVEHEELEPAGELLEAKPTAHISTEDLLEGRVDVKELLRGVSWEG